MLGIAISKINGLRSREVIRSVFHPIRGREWDYSVSETVRDYALGVEPPRYPVPAIPLTVKWIGEETNPFYGLEIRDHKGWANVTWSREYGWEYHPRMIGQCEYCGGIHASLDCPI